MSGSVLPDIRVGDQVIGAGRPPFVIAEMSGNHNQSLERALAIVDAVAESGASALKLQTYTADTMTLDLAEGDFLITDEKSLWKGETLYRLYQKASTPWEWHGPIFERCRKRGLLAFSTPFDATAVDFLESLHVPLYKIASFENVDLELIRKVAATGKPVILSTGMATVTELEDAVGAARAAGGRDLVLLKCTSQYPAPAESAHLPTIPHMRDLFGCHVGLSDHTLGIGVSLAAVALGAVALERHVTLRRADGGVDSAFSLEPHELRTLVDEAGNVRDAVSAVAYGPTDEERPSIRFRRSLYVVADVARGERLTPDNVRAIRPGFGLAPKYLGAITGRRVTRDVKRGTPVSWDLITD